jgi:hypothetical protein
VPLQVKLSLESPVDRLDDLPQRIEQVLPGTPGLAFADRAQQHQLTLGEIILEVMAEIVLVPDQRLPGVGVHHVAASLQHAHSSVSGSSALAPASANNTGSPDRVQTRCSRNPQKYRV